MKNLTVLLALLASTALLAGPSYAEPIRKAGRFGLGLGAGTMSTGLSGKYFLATSHALQANLGVYGAGGADDRWSHFGGFGFGLDYLYEMPTITRAGQVFDLAWNIGFGGGIGATNHDDGHGHGHGSFALAAAFVLGLEFNFIPAPIDIVIEYRPGLLIIPHVGFDLIDFTAQIRFYF